MDYPIYTGDSDLNKYLFRKWTYENKQKADRMLAAVMALNRVVWGRLTEHGEDYEAMSELYNAALAYENKQP